MKKRTTEISTKFSVDGLPAVKKGMSSTADGVNKLASATSKIGDDGLIKFAGAANVAAGSVGAITDGAKLADKALDGIDASGLAARIKSEAQAAGRALADIGPVDLKAQRQSAAERKAELLSTTSRANGVLAGLAASDRDAGARRAAQDVDVSGIDPAVAKRAVAAYKKALSGGVELEIYVDEDKSVRLVRDQLRALERKAGKLNIEAFDQDAIKAAAKAVKDAAREGKALTEYVDKSTGTVFDAEQLAEVVKHADRLDREFAEAAESAEKVADEEKKAAREARTLARNATIAGAAFGTTATVARTAGRGIRGMGLAGLTTTRIIDRITRSTLAMGATISRTTLAATRRFKTLAVAAGGVALGSGIGVGAAAAFGVKSAWDTVEQSKQTRAISALTGADVSVVSFLEQYGARAGLEGTDLAQVMSGFTSAIKDAREPTTEQAKLFKALGVSITDVQGRMKPFANIFTEFLAKADALPAQLKGGLFTTIFGEDDALKVAQLSGMIRKDYAGLNGQYQEALKSGRLVTNDQIKSTLRFEKASLRLKATWEAFKRQLFVGVEPIFTKILTVVDKILDTNRTSIVETIFVEPIKAAYDLLRQFLKLFTGFDPFQAIGEPPVAVSRWLINLKVSLGLIGGLIKAAGIAIAEFARQIGGRAGIDFSRMFDSDAIRDFVAVFVGRMFRLGSDLRKIISGQFTELETDLATKLVRFGALIGIFILETQTKFEDAFASVKETVSAAIDAVQEKIKDVIDYFKLAWEEAKTAGDGLGFAGITTMLGDVLYILRQTVEWVKRFSQAFDAVFVRRNDAPAGFEWMVTVRETLDKWGKAISNIARALKPVVDAFDMILEKMGGMNTATVVLAGLILSKLVGAATTLAGVLAGIGAFFGIGGAAAGGTAAGSAASGAAGGAAAAGAAGGFIAVLGKIGSAIAALVSRLIPIVAIIGSAVAAYKLLEANVDNVLNKVGMGSESVDAAVSKARQQMNADLDKYGTSQRLDENFSRTSFLRPVYGSPTSGSVDRMIRYDQSEKPSNVVNLYLDENEKIQVSATNSQLDDIRRSMRLKA